MPTNVELSNDVNALKAEVQRVKSLIPEQKSEGSLIPVASEVRVNLWPVGDSQYKVILGWKSVVDDVQLLGHAIAEDQKTEITLEDGEKKIVPLRDFYRLKKQEKVMIDLESSTVIQKEVSAGDNPVLSPHIKKAVFLYKDKEFEFDPTFLN